jgi:hypothetical protein
MRDLTSTSAFDASSTFARQKKGYKDMVEYIQARLVVACMDYNAQFSVTIADPSLNDSSVRYRVVRKFTNLGFRVVPVKEDDDFKLLIGWS